MLINVTADDIANGNRRSALYCALSIALSRATGEHCWVGFREVSPAKSEDFPLPAKARRWQRRYDRWQKVRPFSFEINW